jgi:hypothetical protein
MQNELRNRQYGTARRVYLAFIPRISVVAMTVD